MRTYFESQNDFVLIINRIVLFALLDNISSQTLGSKNHWLKLKNGTSSLELVIDANQTTTEYSLYQSMRHAFGHVFGLQHNTSNFMSAIPKHIKQKANSCDNTFSTIDKKADKTGKTS